MKKKISEIVLITGVLCFVLGAALLGLGLLQPPQPHSIAALGLILVAAGAGGKQRWK